MDVQLKSNVIVAQGVLNQQLRVLTALAHTNPQLLGKIREYASRDEYQYSTLFTTYIETFTRAERRLLVALGIFNYEGHPRMNEDARKVVMNAITEDNSVINPVADESSDAYTIADDYLKQL